MSPRESSLRFMPLNITAALTLLLLSAIPCPLQAIDWHKAGNDLELAKVDLNSGSFFSAQMLAVRSTLERFRPAVLMAGDQGKAASDVRNLCQKAGAALCINANFFDPQGNPLGVIVSRGILRQKVHRGGNTLSGIFQVGRSSVEILHRDNFKPELALEALQAGPRILATGQRIKVHDESVSKRAGLCLTRERKLIIYIVTAVLGGVSIKDLQEELLKPEFNCLDALNLDGGGSAQLYLSGTIPGAARDFDEIFVPGYDNVPVALALFAK